MKTSSIIVTLFIALLVGCGKPAHETIKSPSPHPKILEVTVLDSYPKGLAEFPVDQLNTALEDWTEVDHADFYYESADTKINYPYQDGHFVSSDSREGSWRYYQCTGMRIGWGGEPYRYFLPADVASATTTASK